MKHLYVLIALAALTAPAAADVPEGCTPVIANWETAPTYSCRVLGNGSQRPDVARSITVKAPRPPCPSKETETPA